jgi:hypothetical protein
MSGDEWMMFCIEKRLSKKQHEIMFVKRINRQRELSLIVLFKTKEKEWFIAIALDTTRRHELVFTMDDLRGKYCWVHYSKKEKRFTNICYEEDGCWHHIFLKHSPYLKPNVS